MFLRSLIVKGFKSFADPVTIDLSPGVSVIVGPNGSGKSNIADAIAWVLGAQGPKMVRSSKMDEVIFSGAGRRGPLGRAEVSIVIDNSDGGLELDLAEVMITRTLFRTGESEYLLNGNPCRLIDLQELLSGAGVGRQQHVIISQGQLDLILNSKPEERREVIEEAAGITKFKRRRERTERRLNAMEGDLVRAGDLVREVKRQIKPLVQQAAKASRQLELRDRTTHLKRYIAGAELRALESAAEAVAQERIDAELAVLAIQGEVAGIDQAVSSLESARPLVDVDDLFDIITRAEALSERIRSTATLARQKRNTLSDRLQASDNTAVVESLTNELRGVSDEIQGVEAQIVELGARVEQLELDEASFRLEENPEISEILQDLNNRFGELTGENGSLLSRRNVLFETLNRVAVQAKGSESRRLRLEEQLGLKSRELERVKERIVQVIELRNQKSSQYLLGVESEKALKGQVDAAEAFHSNLQIEVNSLRAKVSAYEAAIEEGRSKTQAKALRELAGFLGALVDVIDIRSGYEAAFAAAVHGLSSCVLASDQKSAVEGLKYLKSKNLEGSIISVSQYVGRTGNGSTHPPSGVIALRSQVSTQSMELGKFLDQILLNTFVVPNSLDEAIEMHRRFPELIFVTVEGERLGADGFWTASRPMQGTGLALERTRRELETKEKDFSDFDSELRALNAAYSQSATELESMRSELDGAREELARLEVLPERLAADIGVTTAELERVDGELAGLRQREQDAAEEMETIDPLISEKRELLDRLESQIVALQKKMKEQFSRRKELDAIGVDLELKAARFEQARIALERERVSVGSRLANEVEIQRSSEVQLAAWRRGLAGLDHVIDHSAVLESEAQNVAEQVKNERLILIDEAKVRHERLNEARSRRSLLELELEGKRDVLQASIVRGSETKVRLETMGERIRRELGVETEIAKSTPIPEGIRPTQAEHVLRQLEEELAALGPVNELAEFELSELTEKSEFLESQLEDIKASRRELGKVIRSIDVEMLQIFQSAVTDVSRNFSKLFEQLFNGGKGRLMLMEADDPLQAGIEIEVSLPGKSVKRMSLLSGGERALIALAFLFAVFESRPSPFYILDEVEAALDDINLNRFLKLISSFGKASQLLIISHQKRTMEVADLLYGVTMQEGGSTKVVSQRMSEIAVNAR